MSDDVEITTARLNAVMCAAVDGAPETTLDGLVSILDNIVAEQRLPPTAAEYLRVADALADNLFPTRLGGLATHLGPFEEQPIDRPMKVRAIGLVLIAARRSGNPIIRNVAEQLFSHIEHAGYLPEWIEE